MPDSSEILHFDEFRLDPVRGIARDADGAEVRLRPKTFALLMHFLDNPGQLLGREDLLETLWPGVAVTDDSLTQCIGELRQAFGPRAAHVLRTMPKRGYMMIAEVRRDDPPGLEARSQPRPEPMPWNAQPGDAAALRRIPLAVHRFGTPDGDRVCAALADALTTDLIAVGTRLGGLLILPGPDVPGPGYRVRGEVRAVDTELHVTIRLEDGATGIVLWAHRLEQKRDGSPELPEATLLALGAQLSQQVDRHSLSLARRKPVAALSARELCLLGRDRYQQGTEADTLAAKDMFARAIDADPDYAPALAWQAATVQRAVTHGWGSPGGQAARDEALRLSRRAVQLEPDAPLCLAWLAFSLVLHQRWEDAVAAARAALNSTRPALAPARNVCCEVLTAAGHPEEAVAIAQGTVVLDPLCPPSTYALLGRALLLAGRPEQALEPLRWCVSRLPDYLPAYDSLTVAAMESGRLAEAAAAWGELSRLRPGWIPDNNADLWFFRNAEDVERFQTAYRRLAEDAGTADRPQAAPALQPLRLGTGGPLLRPGLPSARSDSADEQILAHLRRDTLVLRPLEVAPDDQRAMRAASVLTADLTAELVRYENLRVVAGPDDGLKEGSRMKAEIHSAGEQVCTVIRLEDVCTGIVFWAKRLEWRSDHGADVPAEDVRALAAAIDLQIGRETLRRARQKPAERLSARESAFLGKELYERRTEANTEAARAMFVRASAIDPKFAPAHAWHALTLTRAVVHGWNGPEPSTAVEQAVGLARLAVELEPESSISLASLALSLALQERWEEAVGAARLVLHGDRAPGDGARIASGEVLAAAGYPEEAEAVLRQTIIRNPHGSPVAHAVLGRALLLRGHPEEAVSELRQCAALLPDYALCFRTMVVAAVEAGLIDDAHEALRQVGRLRPGWVQGTEPIFWFLRKQDDLERCKKAFQIAVRLDAAVKAGGLLEAPTSRA